MRNRPENQIKLVFIRHGVTKSNKEHRYLGKTEEHLSPEGIEELKREKQRGIYPDVDVLFASPMKRCLETAELLYPDRKVIPIPEFAEMDFGAFEGKNYKELQHDFRYQAWIDSNGTLPFPEGESREDFIQRCATGFYKMLDLLRETKVKHNITAGAIVHGGTIMSILSRFYGGDYFDYQISNANGYLCELRVDKAQVRFGIPEKIE